MEAFGSMTFNVNVCVYVLGLIQFRYYECLNANWHAESTY